MNKSTLKICPYCNGKGKVGTFKYIPASKMKALMKRHSLTQLKIAELCGITQTGVSNWFDKRKNGKGVKSTYFDILEKHGYK